MWRRLEWTFGDMMASATNVEAPTPENLAAVLMPARCYRELPDDGAVVEPAEIKQEQIDYPLEDIFEGGTIIALFEHGTFVVCHPDGYQFEGFATMESNYSLPPFLFSGWNHMCTLLKQKQRSLDAIHPEDNLMVGYAVNCMRRIGYAYEGIPESESYVRHVWARGDERLWMCRLAFMYGPEGIGVLVRDTDAKSAAMTARHAYRADYLSPHMPRIVRT
jgi:hypothetical protein